jgi:hypothetical protein
LRVYFRGQKVTHLKKSFFCPPSNGGFFVGNDLLQPLSSEEAVFVLGKLPRIFLLVMHDETIIGDNSYEDESVFSPGFYCIDSANVSGVRVRNGRTDSRRTDSGSANGRTSGRAACCRGANDQSG